MGTTTNYDLPYPEQADTPDVPRDVQALAEATDTHLAALGRSVSTGVQLVRVASDVTLQKATHAVLTSVTVNVANVGCFYVAQAAPMVQFESTGGSYKAFFTTSVDGAEVALYTKMSPGPDPGFVAAGSGFWSGSLAVGSHTIRLLGWIDDPNVEYANNAKVLFNSGFLVTLYPQQPATSILPVAVQ